MGLNKVIGNMYEFLNEAPWTGYTWNPIRGRCPHNCSYCSIKGIAKRYNRPQRDLGLVEHELKTDLGENNFIFVGSSTDMFAKTVQREWIKKVLAHCRKYPKNKYLFQSKNPERFIKFKGEYPNNVVFGTTIESNRRYPEIYNDSPPIIGRIGGIYDMRKEGEKVMVTMEPILDFDIHSVVKMMVNIQPEWINIGADSKGHKMPEPDSLKIKKLIQELESKGLVVKPKHNLKRLIR